MNIQDHNTDIFISSLHGKQHGCPNPTDCCYDPDREYDDVSLCCTDPCPTPTVTPTDSCLCAGCATPVPSLKEVVLDDGSVTYSTSYTCPIKYQPFCDICGCKETVGGTFDTMSACEDWYETNNKCGACKDPPYNCCSATPTPGWRRNCSTCSCDYKTDGTGTWPDQSSCEGGISTFCDGSGPEREFCGTPTPTFGYGINCGPACNCTWQDGGSFATESECLQWINVQCVFPYQSCPTKTPTPPTTPPYVTPTPGWKRNCSTCACDYVTDGSGPWPSQSSCEGGISGYCDGSTPDRQNCGTPTPSPKAFFNCNDCKCYWSYTHPKAIWSTGSECYAQGCEERCGAGHSCCPPTPTPTDKWDLDCSTCSCSLVGPQGLYDTQTGCEGAISSYCDGSGQGREACNTPTPKWDQNCNTCTCELTSSGTHNTESDCLSWLKYVCVFPNPTCETPTPTPTIPETPTKGWCLSSSSTACYCDWTTCPGSRYSDSSSCYDAQRAQNKSHCCGCSDSTDCSYDASRLCDDDSQCTGPCPTGTPPIGNTPVPGNFSPPNNLNL